MPLIRRLRSAWRRHGPAQFAQLIVKNVVHHSRALVQRPAERSAAQASIFDQEVGSQTEAVREIGSLDIDSANARHAVRYQPSPAELATCLIGSLEIAHESFRFIDFGAGKGRVLMIAARWPFQSVTGIEFALELCQVAEVNLKLPDPQRRSHDLSCIHQDATLFDIPGDPLVCYFYNPFGAPVMQAVADRLVTSLHAAPREAYIIYVHPEHRSVFDATGHWVEHSGGPFHAVLRWRGRH